VTRRYFTKLFNQYSDPIYRFAYWKTGNEDTAKDVVSMVFAKAWEKHETFDGKHAQAWLYTIARNIIIDGYRRKEAVSINDIAEPTIEDGTAEIIDRAYEKQKLGLALDTLKEEHRLVVHLRFIERCSVHDVAEVTGLSEENVRVIQFRALKKLKQWYNNEK
jgi:RNA polymerase sigma-70 factor, ECF subfamily